MRKEDIAAGLKKLGLKRGDVVLLHSALSSFGRVEGGADAVIDAFLDTLGKEGTLVVPIFGALGVITEVVRNRPNAVRSVHPMAAVAAIGAKAEEICRDHWKADTAHGEGTPYTKIRDLNGYVCLLGVDQDRNTTLHTVEELLELPYLKTTEPKTFPTPEGEITRSWKLFPGPHRDFIGIERLLAESGKMLISRIGDSIARLIRSRDLIELAVNAGRKNPAFVLCDNPNCADCVQQRADLRLDFLSRESFRLAASSFLAGRHVQEMIENLKRAGVDRVEIDAIQGKPAHALSAKRLASIVADFHESKIEVASIRFSALTEKTEKAIEAAAECKIPRILLPLALEAELALKTATAKGLAVSLFNTVQDGAKAAEVLQAFDQRGLKSGFTFNAANFARAGEKPFLKTFKTKVKRFMDGLDIEDACFDGTQVPLMRGNAEIKEMISILRCASFSGVLTLTAGNRFVATLQETVERFVELAR